MSKFSTKIKICQMSTLSKIVKNCQKLSNIVKNCQNCKNCQNVCQVTFPHHSDQVSQRSQVSRIALWWSSLNVFVSVSVFVFVFVIVSTSVYFLNRLTPHAWVSSWRLLPQPEPNSGAHLPFNQTMLFLVRVGLSYFTTNKRKQDCFWPDPEHINQQNKALMHWSYFWTCPELGQKSK